MNRILMMLAMVMFGALPLRAAVDIVEVTSEQGIKAWLVQEPSIPFLALEIRFRGGASLDTPNARGAVNLMTGLLNEGAGDLDAQSYAKEVESLAASFSFDVGPDSLSISARFLSENRKEAVQLLRKALVEPRFDQDAIDRVRSRILAGLRSDLNEPEEIARARFDEMAYGLHPYGSDYRGTIQSVEELTRDDIRAAHQAVMTKDRTYVGVAGDISPEELGPLLDELLAGLPASGASQPAAAELDFDAGITVVDFDTPQSVVVFGHTGMDQDDPDFFAARLLNQILGAGGFESRLMDEIRKNRGLTYGIYTYLLSRDHAAVLMGQVATSNDRVAETISVIREEWERAATEGVSEEELDAAKTYMTGAYPLNFDGNSRIARIMVGMQMLDLPIDYIPTRNDKVNAVTLEDVNRVVGTLLQPDNLRFVVVGRPEGLDEGG